MATTFTKQVTPIDGNWKVTIGIVSKDPDDVTFAQQHGDLDIDFSGQYVDPLLPAFTFSIPAGHARYSDILLNKLPNITFTYLFDDATVASATRYKQAVIFANAMQETITDALEGLRALAATPPVNTTFIV